MANCTHCRKIKTDACPYNDMGGKPDVCRFHSDSFCPCCGYKMQPAKKTVSIIVTGEMGTGRTTLCQFIKHCLEQHKIEAVVEDSDAPYMSKGRMEDGLFAISNKVRVEIRSIQLARVQQS